MRINLNLLVLFFVVSSCTGQFDSTAWKSVDSSVESGDNTRSQMADDLLENYLEKSMTKAQVLELLGDPNEQGVQKRVAPEVARTIPDSISAFTIVKLPKEEQADRMEQMNKWLTANSEMMDLFVYNSGWRGMDPLVLFIRFENDKVIDYWLSQL